MIAILHSLAERAASLRSLGEDYSDPVLKAIARDIAEEWAETIDLLAEQQGALNGSMPWWSDFQIN